MTGAKSQLVGRRQGDDIVQEGTRPDGALVRWSFCEITPSSFHWKGESSPDGGRTWRLEAEFLGRRMRPGDGDGRRG